MLLIIWCGADLGIGLWKCSLTESHARDCMLLKVAVSTSSPLLWQWAVKTWKWNEMRIYNLQNENILMIHKIEICKSVICKMRIDPCRKLHKREYWIGNPNDGNLSDTLSYSQTYWRFHKVHHTDFLFLIFASCFYYYWAGCNPHLWWTNQFILLAFGVFRKESQLYRFLFCKSLAYFHFANYRFLFCKSLAYFHFTNYRFLFANISIFPFHKLQISILQIINIFPFHKLQISILKIISIFPFRKLQISILQIISIFPFRKL